jgi:hypothetical protein
MIRWQLEVALVPLARPCILHRMSGDPKSKHITIGTGSSFLVNQWVTKTNNQGYCLCPRLRYLTFPLSEQAWMLRELRACRYGYLLALHILLLCAHGKTPSEIADFLLCSRRERLPDGRRLARWHAGRRVVAGARDRRPPRQPRRAASPGSWPGS